MRLVTKLSVYLIGASAIALAARAGTRVAVDVARFDDDMRHGHLSAGRVLATSVEDAWRARGDDAARQVLKRADGAGVDLAFRWVGYDDPRAELGPDDRSRLDAGGAVHRLASGPRHRELISYVAVMPGVPAHGLVELHEPVAERQAYLHADVRDVIVMLGILLIVLGALAVGLSRRLVGRPVAELVAKARRVSEGDLTQPLDLRGPDELVLLADEMNAMCERLAIARARVETELEAKLQARRELRHAERLATIGTLAAGIAHELGTPLSVVVGHAQMITGREVEGERAIASAKVIEQQVERITRVIRQLLDFARRKGPEGGCASLLTTARETCTLLEPLARRAEVTIEVAGDGEVEAVIERAALEQVVTNLAVNAIHAMPSGGTLRIQASRERTSPPGSTSSPATYARLDVADDGSGISPETAARMFDPFFTTKGPGEGTGLGLSVVHGIVEDHGGFITLETEVGRGTTLSVYLPVPES